MDKLEQGKRPRLLRSGSLAALALGIFAIGAAPQATVAVVAPAMAETSINQLPAPPVNGVMGFVVHHFVYSVIQGKDACPQGPALKNREIFLGGLDPAERERLEKKEHEAEFGQRWIASMSRPDGSNICSQYSQFPDRPHVRQVQSPIAWGLNLDGDEGDGSGNSEGCAHETFTSPDGEKGIDNQAYRAMGCTLEWRGVDGGQGDIVRGYDGFLASGEFTQAILLRGVDSLVNDDNVEVIYGNTPDRPMVDSAGKFIHGASFTISDKAPRERNVLRGRIVNGVLMTQPQDIKLTQTWGQSAQRDLRGTRSRWDLRRSLLRLAFQPYGTLKGIVGG